MKIKLDEKHYLNSDPYCYWVTCLVEPGKDSRKKKPYEVRVTGYLPTFELAVESYIDGKINSSMAVNLSKLKEDIKALKAEVRGWKDATK